MNENDFITPNNNQIYEKSWNTLFELFYTILYLVQHLTYYSISNKY